MSGEQKKQSRLDVLRQRKAQLDARIRQVEQKEVSRQRKDDTRLKVLIGAAFLADTAKHPETATTIKAVLARAIQKANDQSFLKTVGWLDEPEK